MCLLKKSDFQLKSHLFGPKLTRKVTFSAQSFRVKSPFRPKADTKSHLLPRADKKSQPFGPNLTWKVTFSAQSWSEKSPFRSKADMKSHLFGPKLTWKVTFSAQSSRVKSPFRPKAEMKSHLFGPKLTWKVTFSAQSCHEMSPFGPKAVIWVNLQQLYFEMAAEQPLIWNLLHMHTVLQIPLRMSSCFLVERYLSSLCTRTFGKKPPFRKVTFPLNGSIHCYPFLVS